jgi:metal-dependent amidase/aminoacylase/carboxypeptidase family protein
MRRCRRSTLTSRTNINRRCIRSGPQGARADTGLEQLLSSIVPFCQKLAKRSGLELRSETKQHFAANNNDAAIANVIRQAALESGLGLIELPEPLKGGEDFGLFTARFPCCMALLGAGENSPALHNPDSDFPDDLLEPGCN